MLLQPEVTETSMHTSAGESQIRFQGQVTFIFEKEMQLPCSIQVSINNFLLGQNYHFLRQQKNPLPLLNFFKSHTLRIAHEMTKSCCVPAYYFG